MTFSYCNWFKREIIQAHPNTLFVFGDNLVKRGFGGQAKEARGEPNAIGIPTKRYPSMEDKAFFTNNDYDNWVITVQPIINKLRKHTGNIAWPQNGIGTGLAQLSKRAPRIAEAIKDIHDELANK